MQPTKTYIYPRDGIVGLVRFESLEQGQDPGGRLLANGIPCRSGGSSGLSSLSGHSPCASPVWRGLAVPVGDWCIDRAGGQQDGRWVDDLRVRGAREDQGLRSAGWGDDRRT